MELDRMRIISEASALVVEWLRDGAQLDVAPTLQRHTPLPPHKRELCSAPTAVTYRYYLILRAVRPDLAPTVCDHVPAQSLQTEKCAYFPPHPPPNGSCRRLKTLWW